jgi:hypothetical protein
MDLKSRLMIGNKKRTAAFKRPSLKEMGVYIS